MAEMEWFSNEIELVNDFFLETDDKLAIVDAYDNEIKSLKEQKAKLESEIIKTMWMEGKIKRLDDTISHLEEVIKERVMELQQIKQKYMAEEIVDTMETLGSAEEGEELSNEVCEVIKKISFWMRKYHSEYIL